MVRQSAEVENQLTSAERLVEYGGGLAKEVDEISAMDATQRTESNVSNTTSTHSIPSTVPLHAPLHTANASTEHTPSWPRDGAITAAGLRMWYDTTGTPVLNGLDFNIRSGEKIGIVGRTGAGKSSLFGALLRMSPTSGTVCIAGVDTKTLSLRQLRSAITVIPQDPV